ncbi:carbonyl reductase [Myxozyma melibiosi]|uniref:Carbonyl reductase n=1 Tax=Myxozyma melibiosi TaxID=54550 RepID=A0ABR1EZ53_9ASCO
MTEIFSLKGKTALITGASQGIGLAIATSFAKAGANIVLGYNSTPATKTAEDLANETGVKVVPAKIPVTDIEAVDAAFKLALDTFSTVDIVVSNAGITWTAGELIDPPTDKEWREIMSVNVDGNYNVAKAAGKIFKAQGKGSLIFTSSISALIVNVPQRQAAYNISKAAVTALAKNLAVEWASFARVNSVSPGYTITEITKFADAEMRKEWAARTPLGREALPSELVGAYLYLASDASTYTTGSDIVVDGGYTLV